MSASRTSISAIGRQDRRGGEIEACRSHSIGVATINDHAEALAAELRRRLAERRRADAAAGRRDAGELADAVAELVADEAAVLSPARARARRAS